MHSPNFWKTSIFRLLQLFLDKSYRTATKLMFFFCFNSELANWQKLDKARVLLASK